MRTFSREFTSCNIIEVEVGTNCPMGGDSGHGGKTIFRLTDKASTDMSVNGSPACDLLIEFGGDCECDNFISALEFAVKILKKQRSENIKTRRLSNDRNPRV